MHWAHTGAVVSIVAGLTVLQLLSSTEFVCKEWLSVAFSPDSKLLLTQGGKISAQSRAEAESRVQLTLTSPWWCGPGRPAKSRTARASQSCRRSA